MITSLYVMPLLPFGEGSMTWLYMIGCLVYGFILALVSLMVRVPNTSKCIFSFLLELKLNEVIWRATTILS